MSPLPPPIQEMKPKYYGYDEDGIEGGFKTCVWKLGAGLKASWGGLTCFTYIYTGVVPIYIQVLEQLVSFTVFKILVFVAMFLNLPSPPHLKQMVEIQSQRQNGSMCSFCRMFFTDLRILFRRSTENWKWDTETDRRNLSRCHSIQTLLDFEMKMPPAVREQ